MNVTTSMLECFVAIVDEQGSGNAARALGISQPSVSGTLRNLETELGVELFRREANALVLSPEGAALLPVARRTVADQRAVERLVDRLQPAGATSIVRIGISRTSVSAPLMTAFVAAAAGTTIDLETIADPADAVKQVRVGQIDCAVVPDVELALIDLASVYLPDEALVLALPPVSGHVEDLEQLSAMGPLSLVAQAHSAEDQVLDALKGFGIEATVVLRGVSQAALPDVVALGAGAAVMPESLARSVVDAGGAVIAWPVPSRVRALLVYSTDYSAPLTNSFIDQLVHVLREGPTVDDS